MWCGNLVQVLGVWESCSGAPRIERETEMCMDVHTYQAHGVGGLA